MKSALFLLIATIGLAEDAPKPPPAIGAMTSNKSVIVVDPKARSSDYVQAFDLLHKDNPTMKIMLRTTSSVIPNITSISVATAGTLLIVKTLSNQGTKLQVVPVEEVMEINYSP